MKRAKLWAGLDVGVETTSVCVVDAHGEILRETTCPTSTRAVRHELTAYRRSRYAGVFLESGLGAHLARGLKGFGYPIELFETRKLSKLLRARRNKTDAGDASGIAEAGRIGTPVVTRVYLKSRDSECLQARLTIRRHLIRQRVATGNLIGRLVEQFGGRLPRSRAKGQLKRNVQAEIRRLLKNDSHELVNELQTLVEHHDRLDSYKRDADRDLEKLARGSEVCCRFMEIPGVGPICALNFYAAVSEPHRFQTSTDVGSYFGLAPSLFQSGLTHRIGRISKMGNRAVRSSLVRAAVAFMRYGKAESDLRTWALAVEERRGKLRSRVALARKLAIVMIAMWKNGSHYEPQHIRT